MTDHKGETPQVSEWPEMRVSKNVARLHRTGKETYSAGATERYIPISRVKEKLQAVLDGIEREADEAPELTGRTVLVVKAEGVRDALAAIATSFPDTPEEQS